MVGLNTVTKHTCRMPRRRGKWKNRIYICNCKAAWTAVYHQSGSSMAEVPAPGYYLWYPVSGVSVGEEAVYIHG